jgi:hypothetical protein
MPLTQVGSPLPVSVRHQLLPLQPVCVPGVQAPVQLVAELHAAFPAQVTGNTTGQALPSPAHACGAVYWPTFATSEQCESLQ